MSEERISFSFGENWLNYLEHIGPERYAEAKQSVRELLGPDALRGRSVIDVGCGSGIFSLAAVELGAARVVSLDVDPNSVEACERVRRECDVELWEVREGSVLDDNLVRELGRFDVVYSWGVLHHTGEMWRAIGNAAAMVAPGGTLAVAIYNRTRTLGLWLRYKRLYNRSGRVLKALLVWALVLPRMLVRLLKGRHPLRDRRGMSVYYDAVDWAGGLPYECATWQQVEDCLAAKGFILVGGRRTRSTGCNEFVFELPAEGQGGC